MAAIPQTHLYTAEEFAALPADGWRMELVRGEIITMPPAFDEHGETAINLSIILGIVVRQQRLGKLYAAETGFLVERNPDTVRAPDLAFIRKERVPPKAPKPGWVQVTPDLVVEVVSSGDRPGEIAEKVRMWQSVGVPLVWVVYPQSQSMAVHHVGQPKQMLNATDTLDGAEVVPGFTTSVRAIFE